MNNLREPVKLQLTDYSGLINATTTNEGMDIITHIPNFFTDKLNTVLEFFNTESEVIKNYPIRNMNVYARDLNNGRYKLHKIKNNINYTKLKRRLVPVTVGLNVDVLKMTSTLDMSNKLISDSSNKLLKETNATIAKLVTDDGYRLSSKPMANVEAYRNINKMLKKNIETIIDTHQTSDVIKFEKLVPTIPALEKAVETGIAYSLDSNLKMYEELQHNVETIKNYVEALYDTFKKDGKNIKKERILEVSEYVGLSADFITQVFNTIYLSNQSVIILNNAIKVTTK